MINKSLLYLKGLLRISFDKRTVPYWFVLALDASILVVSFIIGQYYLYGIHVMSDNFWVKLWISVVCLLPYIFFFRVFHTYNHIVRYSSLKDLSRICAANGISSMLLITMHSIDVFAESNIYPRRSAVVFAFFFGTLMMMIWRMLARYLYEVTFSGDVKQRIFIYGNNSIAANICKGFNTQNSSKFNVKGFIATNMIKSHGFMAGEKIYKNDEKLLPAMQKQNVTGVLVAPMCVHLFREDDKLIDSLVNANIKIYMFPEVDEMKGEEASMQDPQRVKVEDLLPRSVINVDMVAIGNLLRNKRILVTGAAGSIGSEIVEQVAQFGPEMMILIDQAESPMHDVRRKMESEYPNVKAKTIVTTIINASRMESLFEEYKPDYVFHAAAYKHVPMMEDNPSEAVQNNIYGTRVVADLAVKYGTKKFVMISTDKAVNPTNVMGCSKRICEIYCQSLNDEIHKPDSTIRQGNGDKAITQFVTTRFGNVLGSNGSVIPIFREQIRRGGPVTVTHPDIIRYFMLIPEACKLVLQAGTFGKGGEIFVFDMGKPVLIADLAKRMIALTGAKNIEIVYTGLRDGEKLYEEVLSSAETTLPTNHEKIRIAKVRSYSYAEAIANEERLFQASFEYDDMETVRIMKEIVPEFMSQHSKYESLDHLRLSKK